jgi:hypothetical protein
MCWSIIIVILRFQIKNIQVKELHTKLAELSQITEWTRQVTDFQIAYVNGEPVWKELDGKDKPLSYREKLLFNNLVATKRRLQNGIDKAKIKDDEKLQPLAGLV